MTHAECKEQLIDLIYGELPPLQKAEVELHLAGCAECRAERDLLSGTRDTFASLMSGTDMTMSVTDIAESEPGPEFDLPILAAAKEMAAQMAKEAEAGRAKAAAAPAPVISLAEVRAAAAKQAPAPTPDSQRVRRKPQWMRATLVGSIAAAAALALVVSTHHTSEIIGAPPRSADELEVSEQKGAQVRAERVAQAKALDAQVGASPAAAPAPAQSPAPAQPVVPQVLGAVGGVGSGAPRGAGAGDQSATRGPQLSPPPASQPKPPPPERGAGAKGGLAGTDDNSVQLSRRGLDKRDDDTRALQLNPPAEEKPAETKQQFAPAPAGWANPPRDKKAKDAERVGLADRAADDSRDGAGGSAGVAMERKREASKESSSVADRGEAEKKVAAAGPAKKPAPRAENALDMDSQGAPPPRAAAAPRAVATSMPPPPPAAAMPAPVVTASAPPPMSAPSKSVASAHVASAEGKSPAAPASPAADDGPGLEARAAAARASGQLREAGRLYREAAGAFFAAPKSDTSARGSIDLVNAVSCYARAGDLAEARKVRDLLVSLAPEQTSAIAQANAEISAREAPPPSPASAAPANER